MKVGIHASILSNRLTGIGRYVYEICKRLPEVFPDFEFVLISKNQILHNPFDGKNVFIVREENPVLRKLPSSVWFRYFASRIINKLNLDFLWCTVPITPLFLDKNIKKVVSIYDFNLYIVPETMSFKTFVNYKLFFNKAIKEADRIITISKGTAEKLENFFGKKVSAIVRPGVDRNIFRKIKNLKKEYNFRYILSVYTIEPRKNINSLIRAFILLKNEGKLKDIKLVLVGNSGWKNQDVLRLIEKHKEDIIYTGYISDERLVKLYNGAEVFVFPSIYEGFGISVLEARACGCCVITTDIVELREACGEGCIYIKSDVESIKQAIDSFFSKKLKCNYKVDYHIDWLEETKKLAGVFC